MRNADETYEEDDDDGCHEAEDEEVVGAEPAVGGRSVAERIDHRRNGHDEQRHSVSAQVVPLDARLVRLEDLDEHDVELEAFQQHPHESAQEEVVQQSGNDAAEDPVARLVDSGQEDQLGDQQADAQVLVDRRTVTLNSIHSKFNS